MRGQRVSDHILNSTADALSFEVKMSEALAGCVDSTVTLKRIDDKTLKGMRGSRTEVTLTRE